MKVITITTLTGLMAFGSLAMADTATSSTAVNTGESSYSALLILDPAKKTQLDYWDDAVAKFRADETSAPKGATVLLGDSITAGWPAGLFPDKPTVNRGIGGDFIGGWKFPGVGDRLDTSIIALKPKRIFLMIGANDCLDIGPPMETKVAGYALLLDKLKQAAPDAKVYVQSCLPVTRERWEYMQPAIKELNSHIERLAKERGFVYVDLHSKFTGPDGKMRPELTSDGLHVSKDGYELWAKTLMDLGYAGK